VLATFGVLGWFTGWLAGASDSPVVAALLPLVFGIFGAMGIGLLDVQARSKRVMEMLQKSDRDLSSLLRDQVGQPAPADTATLAVWCVGLMVYCATCYGGIQQGITRRVPAYASVEQLIGKLPNASSSELAELHRLRLGLMRQNVAESDAKQIFHGPILGFFSDPVYKPGGALADAADPYFAPIGRLMESIDEAHIGTVASRTACVDVIRSGERQAI
jgi:hypothetical protein